MSNNRYSVKAWEVYNALPQNVKKEHDAQEKKSFLWHLADQIEEHDLIGLGGGAIVSYLVSICLLYTSPSPRDKRQSRMPSSA